MKKTKNTALEREVLIRPLRGRVWTGLRELWLYRELLYFLVWRDIKVRYKQTLIGAAWAILQPFLTMIVFSVFFGKIAKIMSEGIPYPIFSYAGLLLWFFFAQVVSNSGESFINNANLITKVYFPRIIIPLSAAITGIIDYCVALSVLFLMIYFYKICPGYSILFLPLIVFLTFLSAVGLGLWLSALNVKYRDVRYIIPFFIQLLLFATPVIYPVTILPEKHRWVLYLNPVSGMVDAHRACLLNHKPIDWFLLGTSVAVALLIFLSGLAYFRKTERFFADII